LQAQGAAGAAPPEYADLVSPARPNTREIMMQLAMAKQSERILAKKSRVLIVEDHAPTRLAMSKLLRDAGADVITARDGEEGLGFLLTQRFDILLTDLRMPVMDGFELLHHCLALPESRRPVKIVAISGEYEASALRGVPVAFMPKPFDLSTLLEMLQGKPN
jgi:CheY-like chemotaxis protein